MVAGGTGPTSQATATSNKTKSNKRKLLDESDSDSNDGGAAVEEMGFKVNEEYARRFEHNKKREEKHRLEEKFKNNPTQGDDGSDGSSSDETEDEDGFLATEDLDAQISATLQAIQNKDPRVYDSNVAFYQEEKDNTGASSKVKKDKPVFLRDYHRAKLLRGDVGASDNEEDGPQTYEQEQETLKKSIVSEINAAKAEKDSEEDDSEDDDGFVKRKEPARANSNGMHPSRAQGVKTELNISNADKDPETFLSNFMAARAWVADEGSRWEAFESDDGEEDGRADEFEQAYNLRFEDPEKSNEVLKAYARDLTAARSVRRDDKTSRKRQRELEREKKEAEKQQRHEEKARLRNLKLEETEEKLRKIKQAAGAIGKELTDEEWMKFLDDAWEDNKWEDEMKKRFNDEYYAIRETGVNSDEDEMEVDGDKNEGKDKKKRPKKPKWNDDIDIKDIIPDFEDEEARPAITLSGSEEEEGNEKEEQDEDMARSKKRKSSDHKRVRLETQKKARRDRAKLEALVDAKLQLTDHDLLNGESSRGVGPFRYRETSPQSFGMTARDILLAPSDKVLNEFAGLKKLATYRDLEKKRRDKKRLGKKARLRQWRRDVYGGEFERTGPTYGFERVAVAEDDAEEHPYEKRRAKTRAMAEQGGKDNISIGNVDGTKRKRKRPKGKKGAETEALA